MRSILFYLKPQKCAPGSTPIVHKVCVSVASRHIDRQRKNFTFFTLSSPRCFSSSSPSSSSTLFIPPSIQKITVLYGSQTGTAMAFASQLAEELSSNAGIQASAVDIFEYDPKILSQTSSSSSPSIECVVFVMSCFGRGEPSDSAKKFMKYIMDTQAPSLKHLHFAVFGLGSSQTHKVYYNIVGKTLDTRLEQLGAQRMFPRGEGDDSGW